MKKIAAVVMCTLALVASSAQAGNAKEEANKKKVVEFYEKALNQKDVIQEVPEKAANSNGMF